MPLKKSHEVAKSHSKSLDTPRFVAFSHLLYRVPTSAPNVRPVSRVPVNSATRQPAPRLPPVFTELREFALSEYQDPRAKATTYLLDDDMNALYVLDKEERWPLVFGTRDGSGHVVPVHTPASESYTLPHVFPMLSLSLLVHVHCRVAGNG